MASATIYVSSIADALGIDRFGVMGHSGGGPHALACGALPPQRDLGVVSMAGMAPFDAEGLDWFAGMSGPGGQIDDHLAYVVPWGFDPAQVLAPVLFLHGGRDRVVPSSHSEWLARRCPSAELRLSSEDGHISVLTSASAVMEWLRGHAE